MASIDFSSARDYPDKGELVLWGDLEGSPWWMVEAVVDYGRGTPALVSLTVARGLHPDVAEGMRTKAGRDVQDPPALTAELLRSVRVGDIIEEANRHLRPDLRRLPDPRRQRAHDDRYYASWAAHYVNAVASGSRRPTTDLAEEHGLTPEQVRDVIHTCRDKELLTKTKPGVAGGQLTNKALRALGRTPRKGR